mgnify:CR=1 FL=1
MSLLRRILIAITATLLLAAAPVAAERVVAVPEGVTDEQAAAVVDALGEHIEGGYFLYRFADPTTHAELIAAAADDARLILARDPDMTSPRGKALNVLEHLFDWRADRGWAAAG